MGTKAMPTKRFPAISWATCAGVAISAVGLLLSPMLSRPAQACGGFWCSQSAPVNQAAEQIIFVDNPDDTVTAIIQIQYVGPSERFAWVIPIPGKPVVGVSSNVAFQRLDQATAPQYNLEQVVEGMCRQDFFPQASGAFDGAADAGSAPPSPQEKSGVTVLEQGSVGPYNFATIAVDPKLPSPADAAIEWFTTEGYDLSGVDAELLGPYLADGLNLLAFRLTKGNEAGSIQPVVLTYQSELPMIPIRPTAVAAQDNMGIKIWVASDKQAVPKNYKSLVINEALINWFNFRENYDAVVTAAADEAQGQGFVTEMAGATDKLADKVFSPTDEMQWQQLKSQTFVDGFDAIVAANNYYRSWDGWRDAIAETVKDELLQAGVTIDEFGRNPDAYRGTVKIDIAKFFAQLEEKLIKPARETEKMLQSRPYLTRLYSTMSADEMTLDPAFTYNGDLADVSNVHTAKQYITCSPDISTYEAPWRIELPQGGVIRGEGGGNWPIAFDSLPANLKIVQLTTQGAGKVVTDNSSDISLMLFKITKEMPTDNGAPKPPTDGVMIGGDQMLDLQPDTGDDKSAAMSGGSDCSVVVPGARNGTSALWALPLFALLLRRRRALR